MSRKHQAKLPKLNRDSDHRKALFKILLCDLIEIGYLNTTIVKAKIIKRHFDKLMTVAKRGTLASRRLVIGTLSNTESANRLVDIIVPLFGNRQSGFTTLSKVSVRKGDATAMGLLKLLVEAPARVSKVAVKKVKEAKVVKTVKSDKKEVKKVEKKSVKKDSK